METRFRWALLVAALWALVPLACYLPGAAGESAGRAVFWLCLPAAYPAYFLVGGVHNGAMDFFPLVCSLLTFAMAFGGTVLLSSVRRSRR